ncbi:hypothetical protein ACFY78_42305, partial [Streptomyces olindensis]
RTAAAFCRASNTARIDGIRHPHDISASNEPRPPATAAISCLTSENHTRGSERERPLKPWRGLATRTDKLAIAYQAALHLAGILIWTRR